MKSKDFLALVRIPTVFSSMSNAYAGYFIGLTCIELAGSGHVSTLLEGALACGLFIMAGMTLNDIADSDVDARERPGRPIPSGAVSLPQAWGLSLSMLVLGELFFWLANPLSAMVGAVLALSIFAYNFLLKKTFLGPVSMGLCRLLNLLAGITLTWKTLPREWSAIPKPVYLVLFSLWAYIALVTFLARDEVQGNSRVKVKIFLSGIAIWFISWSVVSFTWFKSEVTLALAWLALALSLKTPFKNLASDSSPKNTGQAIGAMLRFVPLVDVLAMFANQVPLHSALAGVLWIVPAYLAGKLFYST